MNYVALRERPTQFLALASLLSAEFDDLLTESAPRWERYHHYHTLDGARRRTSANVGASRRTENEPMPPWRAPTRSFFSC